MKALISAFALVVTSGSTALAQDAGRCAPLDPTNPGHQAYCGRFDTNRLMCEQVSHLCVWQAAGAVRVFPINFAPRR